MLIKSYHLTQVINLCDKESKLWNFAFGINITSKKRSSLQNNIPGPLLLLTFVKNAFLGLFFKTAGVFLQELPEFCYLW